MAKKKDVTIDSLVKVKPITDNQKLVFSEYGSGKNLFLQYSSNIQQLHGDRKTYKDKPNLEYPF